MCREGTAWPHKGFDRLGLGQHKAGLEGGGEELLCGAKNILRDWSQNGRKMVAKWSQK